MYFDDGYGFWLRSRVSNNIQHGWTTIPTGNYHRQPVGMCVGRTRVLWYFTSNNQVLNHTLYIAIVYRLKMNRIIMNGEYNEIIICAAVLFVSSFGIGQSEWWCLLLHWWSAWKWDFIDVENMEKSSLFASIMTRSRWLLRNLTWKVVTCDDVLKSSTLPSD